MVNSIDISETIHGFNVRHILRIGSEVTLEMLPSVVGLETFQNGSISFGGHTYSPCYVCGWNMAVAATVTLHCWDSNYPAPIPKTSSSKLEGRSREGRVRIESQAPITGFQLSSSHPQGAGGAGFGSSGNKEESGSGMGYRGFGRSSTRDSKYLRIQSGTQWLDSVTNQVLVHM